MRHKDSALMDQIKQFLIDFYLDSNGQTPSTKQISEALKIGRTTAYKYLVAMSEKGILSYIDGEIKAPFLDKITVDYTNVSALGRIACGQPAQEEESLLFKAQLPVAVFGKGPFYILYAHGDSMVDAGIEDGDILVIRKNVQPKEGDIIVALDENNENTLKRFAGIDLESHRAILEYMNEEDYPGKKIFVKQLVCQGVLSHVIKEM